MATHKDEPAAGLGGKQVRHNKDTHCKTPPTWPSRVEKRTCVVRQEGTQPGRGHAAGANASHTFSAGVGNLLPGVRGKHRCLHGIGGRWQGYRRCYLGLQDNATPSSHPTVGRHHAAKGTLQMQLRFWICLDREIVLDFPGRLNATT